MTDTTATPGNAPNQENKDTSFFGHPKGLAILFFTEMWERFSYYGMRGLLIIYLTQHFLFSDERSGVMYGAYTALVYIMTIIGGTLADRYLGQRKAVTFGAILLVLGHLGMAFEGNGSRQDITVAGETYELEAEGRGDRQQLFIDYEGEARLLVFRNDSVLTLTGENGETRTFLGERYDATDQEVERAAEFAMVAEPRGFVANICNTFGLSDCAGEAPATTLELPGEGEFPVTVTSVGDDVSQSVTIGGALYQLAESELSYLEIVDDNGTRDNDDDTVLTSVADGEYAVGEPVREQLYVFILYLSLALIIAGVGYLKANISTIVGSLYGVEDKRRDSGFTLFYMGINLGSFLSSITCGILGIVYGWAWGFGLAGIGMLAGLVVFLWGQKYLGGRAEPPNPEKLKKKVLGPITVEQACYLAGLGIIAVSMSLVMNAHVIPEWFVGMLGVAVFVLLVLYSIIKLSGVERSRMFAAIYFVLAQIPFWALFEQAGSSLNLFTDRLVDKTIFGWSVPAPVFQSLNAGFIFIFAPIVAWMWIALAKRNREPSTPVKFAFGVFGVGLGFLALVGGMQAGGSAAMTAVIFIFLIYWIHTMAELLLSPVGLSAVTKLAPARVVGMTMGAWFLYSGLSNYLAGVIAKSTGAETVGGQLTNVAAAKATYVSVYTQVGIIAMLIALVMLLISPIIKRLMAEAQMTPHPTETEAGGPSMDRSSDAP
ncbi:peptide MFS transporter [Maricaulis sp.]|uniref:peptide MFS transporter n=1 Tax=Maricaulis sp. TaxID=1486257 RepID=UPI002B27289A|nr:peptide MFS transporter [Maricaulis sp.]